MLRRSHNLTTLPTLAKEWRLSFEFNRQSSTYTKAASIMHLSIGNTGAVGDRTPAIWFHPKTGVQVATTLNGVANVAKKFRNQKPSVGEWTTFEISQARKGLSYIFSVSIAGIEVWSKTNAKPKEFSEVQVNASSHWYEAQAGSIKAVLIENKLMGKIGQNKN